VEGGWFYDMAVMKGKLKIRIIGTLVASKNIVDSKRDGRGDCDKVDCKAYLKHSSLD